MIITETYGLALSWWKTMHFLLSNSRCFSLSATFSWEQYLLVLITWSSRGAHKKDSLLILLYIQHHLLWMKTAFSCGWWWFISLPHGLFISHHFTVSAFSLPLQFVLKTMFGLCLSRELHAEMWLRRFFHVTYV